jgi:Ran GTPase-activating protein (RanGAP) involved in mRNA processing and transport
MNDEGERLISLKISKTLIYLIQTKVKEKLKLILIQNYKVDNKCFKIIDLSDNQIGGFSFLRAIKMSDTIEECYLSNCNIGIDGCKELNEFLKINRSLSIIDLSNNKITYDCAITLSIGLKKNSTLKILILNDNNITTNGAYELLLATGHTKRNTLSELEYLGLKVPKKQ